jgi:2-iminobutanoate/2-iminopropanoate deaminase
LGASSRPARPFWIAALVGGAPVAHFIPSRGKRKAKNLRDFHTCTCIGQNPWGWAFLLQRLSLSWPVNRGHAVHKSLSPASIYPPFAPYSHGIEVAAGSRLVFCSGQLGIAADSAVPPDCAGQARLCFESIRAILAEAGMDFSHVIKINAFVTGREHLKPYMDVRNSLFVEP